MDQRFLDMPIYIQIEFQNFLIRCLCNGFGKRFHIQQQNVGHEIPYDVGSA